VYIVHLCPAYPDPAPANGHQAKHYSGWAKDLRDRLATHARGGPDAARLLQVQLENGGTWQLVALEWGTRDREKQLKYSGASRRCCRCDAERDPAGPAGAPAADIGWVYVLHLEPRHPRKQGQPGEPQQTAHHIGFTADTEALLAATARGGRDAARALQVAEPRGGTWRLVSAGWGSRDRARQLTGRAAAHRCPACTPPRAQPRPAELLDAIDRGEVAGRFHPRYGWAARWHTLHGRPLTTTGDGGKLGRNVTAAAAALVRRGLAEFAGDPGQHTDRAYRITQAGRDALQAAQVPRRPPAGRPDGLPANRDGSLSRSRTTDEQKQAAGVMTRPQLAEHTALRKHDHPRSAERISGSLPDDQWTAPAADPEQPAPAAAAIADPSWPYTVRQGIAAARRPAGGARRPATAAVRRPAPVPARSPGMQ